MCFSLLEALQTGSAFSREQKRRRGPRVAGGKPLKLIQQHYIASIITYKCVYVRLTIGTEGKTLNKS